MVELTDDDKAQIKDFLDECKADGEDNERFPFLLSQFISHRSNQTQNRDLLFFVNNSPELKKILDEYNADK